VKAKGGVVCGLAGLAGLAGWLGWLVWQVWIYDFDVTMFGEQANNFIEQTPLGYNSTSLFQHTHVKKYTIQVLKIANNEMFGHPHKTHDELCDGKYTMSNNNRFLVSDMFKL
jgi:hypothetical protein